MNEAPGRLTFMTKTDSVAEALRREILHGDLRPGTALQQEEVAQRLGVSSTPVREAFVLLEAEGFVEKRAHHGVVVAARNSSEVSDVHEIRLLLEPLVLRKAYPNIDDAVIAELERSISDAERALPDIHGYRRANTRFHEILVNAAGSTAYAEVMKVLLGRSLFAVPLDRRSMAEMLEHHRGLVRLLKRRDSARAEKLLEQHLRRMSSLFRAATGAEAAAERTARKGARRPATAVR